MWAMRMKVTLKVHEVWEAVELGTTDANKNVIAMALLFQSIPENLILQIGELEEVQAMWEAIKSWYLGADRVREARLETLSSEFDRLTINETEKIDDLAGRISSLAFRSAALGQNIEEHKLVKKFLSSLPRDKFIHIVASLEQVLDLKTIGFEDIIGRLKASKERIGEQNQRVDQNKLLFNASYEQASRGGLNGRGRG